MKPTLIIADDVSSSRLHIESLIEDSFEIVASVESGRAAVDACLRLEPAVVIMDVVMPGISGLEAAEIVVRGPKPHPRFLFVSEVISAAVTHRGLQLGGVFLQKPLDKQRLCDLLLGLAVEKRDTEEVV